MQSRELVYVLLGYWYIGATDKQVEGEFLWTDSKVSLAHSYSKWGPNDPNNFGHDQSCVIFYNYANHGYDWGDVSCELKGHYICKR